jgi:mRNA interferase MazF
MGRLVKGEVVVLAYPFSDLSRTKRRPAVVATPPGDDVILSQMTSRSRADPSAIAITQSNFATGTFHQPGNVRPNRTFAADRGIILYSIGVLKPEVTNRMMDAIIRILRQ